MANNQSPEQRPRFDWGGGTNPASPQSIDAETRRQAWYGEDDSYRRPRARRPGRRGVAVFFWLMLSLLLVSLVAYGFSQYFGTLPDRSDALPSPGWWNDALPDGQPERESPDQSGRGTDDAPDLAVYGKEKSPLYGEQVSGLTIPQISASVSPSVVGIVADSGYSISYGSGIILSENGYVVTNAHVIESGGEIKVLTKAGEEFAAQLVGKDRKTDLAVLKVEATGLPAAQFGNSDELVVGEVAVAIGNPMSMELFGSVTVGVISALDRKVTLEDRTMRLIQTDAAINPGNSGGALVNGYAQVIGINSVKVMTSNYEGIGFAIPSNSVIPIVDALIKNGYVPGRPIVGIAGEDVNEYYASNFNVPRGVYVHGTTPGTGAEGKGLKRGDIVVAIDGVTIKSMAEFNEQKDLHKAGDTVTIRVYRSGQYFEVDITLTEEGKP